MIPFVQGTLYFDEQMPNIQRQSRCEENFISRGFTQIYLAQSRGLNLSNIQGMNYRYPQVSLVGMLTSLLSVWVLAQDLPLVSPSTSDMASQHAEHTAAIRLHRLKHFDAKLNTDPAVLHAACRFESDISTAAPAKRIALTFDDGPEPIQTEFILETLKRHNIPATFFMIGEQAKKHPDLVAKVMAEGHHLIGNHSWDHPNFHSIDVTEQAAQVQRTEDLLSHELKPRLFRYPYGNSTCKTNDLLHEGGYSIVGWHVDSCDWAFDKNGSVDEKEAETCGVLPQYQADYAGHVLSAIRAHDGGIVLMHEIHPNTLRHLDSIVTTALKEGYVFVSIDDAEFMRSMR